MTLLLWHGLIMRIACAWYDDLMVSCGDHDNLGNVRSPYSYSLPSGYSPSDIEDILIAESSRYFKTCAYYKDHRYSCGRTYDLDLFNGPRDYSDRFTFTDCGCSCGPETCSGNCGNYFCERSACGSSEWVLEMAELINNERSNHGKQRVYCNLVASDHAQEFADFLCDHSCHDHPDPHNCAGQTIGDRMSAAVADGLTWYSFMNENIHDASYLDPNLAMYGGLHGNNDITGFMESPGHRANILNSAAHEVGVAYTECAGDGMTYWVQWFGA